VLIIKKQEIYAMVKNPTVTETVRLNRLRDFSHVCRMKEGRTAKKIVYMNLETTKLKGRTRNRWLEEVRKDGKLTYGKVWK
jgi:hypothetical protein